MCQTEVEHIYFIKLVDDIYDFESKQVISTCISSPILNVMAISWDAKSENFIWFCLVQWTVHILATVTGFLNNTLFAIFFKVKYYVENSFELMHMHSTIGSVC